LGLELSARIAIAKIPEILIGVSTQVGQNHCARAITRAEI